MIHARLALALYSLLIFTTFACTKKQDLLIEPPPATAKAGSTITIRPVAGHHLNVQAPHTCGEHAVVDSIGPQGLICRMTDTGTTLVRVGVCDDAVSFCKFQTHEIEVRQE